ncbi:MAG: carbohydrate kinase family protein [Enterobacteriaceae bacterium]
MGQRSGIISAGSLLVDYVNQIRQWPQPGWLVEIEQCEQATGGAPLNVLITLAKMQTSLPLAALGLIGLDSDGDVILESFARYHIDTQYIQRTVRAPTAMTQVMSVINGQRTFFHSLGANRLLSLNEFASLHSNHKIFHLGYLLLLQELDKEDKEFGSVSARLFADMQQLGYHTSLDLVSRQGDPRYQSLLLPTLPWLDYLIINELEAGELTGLSLRDSSGEIVATTVAAAAQRLLQRGVRQRIIIHYPEGALAIDSQGNRCFIDAWPIAKEQIVGTVGAGDAFCAGALYGCHENWDLPATLELAHACAHFNLRCANAIDGAQPLPVLQAFIAQHRPY